MMDNKPDGAMAKLLPAFVLALIFVALAVAATQFGTYLECAGTG